MSSVAFMIFCLNVLSINEGRVLNTYYIHVAVNFSLQSQQSLLPILGTFIWIHMVFMIVLFVWKIDPLIIMIVRVSLLLMPVFLLSMFHLKKWN